MDSQKSNRESMRKLCGQPNHQQAYSIRPAFEPTGPHRSQQEAKASVGIISSLQTNHGLDWNEVKRTSRKI